MVATTLNAGDALNVEIAEKVFGEVEAHAPIGDGMTRTKVVVGTTLDDCDAQLREAYTNWNALGLRPAQYCGPDFAGDIAAAWLVVEAMRAKGWMYCTVQSFYGGDEQYAEEWDDATMRIDYWCEFSRWRSPVEVTSPECATAPLAICLAALKAVSPLSDLHNNSPERASPSEGPQANSVAELGTQRSGGRE